MRKLVAYFIYQCPRCSRKESTPAIGTESGRFIHRRNFIGHAPDDWHFHDGEPYCADCSKKIEEVLCVAS